MLKKIYLPIFVFLLSLSCLPFNAYAELPLRVVVNSKKISFPDAEPYIDENERVQVPVRFVTEALGAAVEWNDQKKEATVRRGDTIVTLTINNKEMYVNGQAQTLDTAPVIIGSRTFVPVRFVSEALGATVEWDTSILTVYIDLTDDKSKNSKGISAKEMGGFNIEGLEFADMTMFGKNGMTLMYNSYKDLPENNSEYKPILSISIRGKFDNASYANDINDTKSVLSQKFSKSLVDKIASYVDSKTEKSTSLAVAAYEENGYHIILQSEASGNGVVITIGEKR